VNKHTIEQRITARRAFWLDIMEPLSMVTPPKEKNSPASPEVEGPQTADSAYKLPLKGKSRSFVMETD
jgi:hypothetical protein